MEFLINPNVSYVLLILGFLTAILALFSPGTGFLELGALFALVLAGYGIANLPVSWWALGLMALAILPFVLALRLLSKFRVALLIVAALAFLTGSALLFGGEGWQPAVHPVLIVLLSLAALGVTWLMATKSLEAMDAHPSFNLDQLVGMTGQVSSDIRGEGTVYVNGEEWSAHSKTFIPAGSSVRVLSRRGLMLEVEIIKP